VGSSELHLRPNGLDIFLKRKYGFKKTKKIGPENPVAGIIDF